MFPLHGRRSFFTSSSNWVFFSCVTACCCCWARIFLLSVAVLRRYPKIYADIYYVVGLWAAVNVRAFYRRLVCMFRLNDGFGWPLVAFWRLMVLVGARRIVYIGNFGFRMHAPTNSSSTQHSLACHWSEIDTLALFKSGVLIFDTAHLQLSRILTTVAAWYVWTFGMAREPSFCYLFTASAAAHSERVRICGRSACVCAPLVDIL